MKLFKKNSAKNELYAVVSGHVKPISQVNDEMFSAGIMGDGIAIEPDSETVLCPCDGIISVIMEDSRHAAGLNVQGKFELLIHIGIDTVQMNGDGFTLHVKSGDKVKQGQPLISFDKAKIQNEGLCADVIVVAIPDDNAPKVEFITGFNASAGETVVANWK